MAATAGGKEPLLEVTIGDKVFYALLDTGSSISLLGDTAMEAAKSTGVSTREAAHSLRLATGWSQTTTSVRCRVRWSGGSRKQRFLHMSGLCRDVVLGRDFLTATGISVHVGLGGWTVGVERQEVVRFDRVPRRSLINKSNDGPIYSLEALFAEPPNSNTLDMTTVSVIDTPGNMSESDPRMASLLDSYKHIFCAEPGCTSLTEHRINTGTNSPVRCKLRPTNAQKRAIIDQCVDDLLNQGLLEPSQSSWASAPVLVAKKTGGYRLAIDYRPLNSRTDIPVYPMPQTDWVLAQLGKAKWFTSLDLSQGFFQIPVAKEDIHKTAFICHKGMFQFKRMPFGVAGGPATFQALMDKVLEGIKHTYCMAFLDDVLIYSESFDEHIEHMREVLNRISNAGLTINPTKVQLCKHSLKFLGHIIAPGECRPDPEKIKAVTAFPEPTSVKQLQAFLGLVGYYRTFIPRFSDAAKPLTLLLRKDVRWSWKLPQQAAFDCLKAQLTANAVVALPDLNKPFVIETDASGVGIGAVLLQETEGQLRPVSFISRTLTPAEQNYTVQEWECLAVVWALDRFRPYIEFTHFEIHCDHASLSWMFSTEQTSSRVRRWVLRLQGFNCTIKHRRGKANIPADALSRFPVVTASSSSQCVAEDWFPIDAEEPEQSIHFEETAVTQEDDISQLSDGTRLVAEQMQDPLLSNILLYLKNNCLPADAGEARQVQDLAGDSEIDNTGVLMYITGEKRVPWVPAHLRNLVLRLSHDHPLSAHAGFFKTMRRTQDQFFWLGMRADISRYVRSCRQCQTLKPRRQKPKGLMDSTWATEPMQQLSVDLIGPLPTTAKQNRHILIVIDKFTKYIELFPIRAPTSRTIVDKMVEVFCRHGVPQSISSDNGKTFVSALWKGVLRHWGIVDRHTTPYRPSGQLVERHNATVKQAIMAYCEAHRDWDKRLPEIAFAMRTNESVVTGYTPAFLCYGRELRTPWDSTSAQDTDASSSAPHAFAAELDQRLQDALAFARAHQNKAQEIQRRQYNSTRQPGHFAVGDLVLKDLHTLSNASKGIAAKLAHKRSGPFTVTA